MPATLSPVVFREELIVDRWAELQPMVNDHHAEVGPLPKDDFEPDRERYELLEKAGSAKLYTMRERDAGRTLVGYAVFFLHADMQFRLTMARCDALYVREKHRGRASMEFMLYFLDELKRLHVDVPLIGVSPRNDFSRSLEKLGFIKAETVYLKRL